MADYLTMGRAALEQEKQQLQTRYDAFAAKGVQLDMSRGKPAAEQLDLSLPLLQMAEYIDEDGTDTRNYGGLEGCNEARRFFADFLGVAVEETIVGGNASLNLMHCMIDLGWRKGFLGAQPWEKQAKVKFLCPSPGYDRHFRVTEEFGIELVGVPMTPSGPDMDMVEKLAQDETVKGIWCIPIYSNPDGYVYSEETVKRLANMKAAADFRIMWDNAYGAHHLFDNANTCPNMLEECRKAGNEDRVLMFCSTSKITFAGGGVSAMAGSKANINAALQYFFPTTICFDKVNQLRHVRFIKKVGLQNHMKKHAQMIAPKFDVVLKALHAEIDGCGEIARWTEPEGGYFISLYVLPGCAKRVVELCKQAGVVLTGAGAAYPYGVDPADSHIRIAPTYPPIEELVLAAELLCISTRLACVEKQLAQ